MTPSSSDGPLPTTNGTSNNATTSGSSSQAAAHLKLAALLRECAVHIERNEFHPDLYQALGLLHAYAGQHAGNPNSGTSAASSTTTDLSSTKQHSGSFEHNAQQLIGSLGKKFTKGLGLSHSAGGPASAAASATSAKNAERVRAELRAGQHHPVKATVGHRSKENDWCDEHFCLGCKCKEHAAAGGTTTTTTTTAGGVTTSKKTTGETSSTGSLERSASKSPTPPTSTTTTSATPSTPSRSTASATTASAAVATPSKVSAGTTTTSTSGTSTNNKPAFQRPVNPNSILIANGWIEQQRRSKMRVVWKDVLASLVEGRKPGEETTLWIQRQVINATTGKAELEALHQIPIKWLTHVDYLDYTTDNRFALRVYNVQEEFLFRCKNAEAAQNWVLTLRSVHELTMKQSSSSKDGAANEAKVQHNKEPTSATAEHAPEQRPSSSTHRMTISELRAIAHGAGINTMGMERRDLEDAVAQIAKASGGGAPAGQQSETTKPHDDGMHPTSKPRQQQDAMDEQRKRGQAVAAEREKLRKQQALEEAEQRQRLMEERKRAAAEEAERRMRAEEEAIRRRVAAAAEEERRRKQALEEEERRRKLAAEAEELRRRKLAEEEVRRQRLAEEEQRRRKQQAEEEARRRKMAEEEARRRAAEQQAAEQRRRQEEAQRQRWQQQQQQQQWQQQQSQQQQWQQRQQPHQQWQQQQQQRPGQQQFFRGRPSSPPGRAPQPPGQAPPPPSASGAPSSPVNQKYAKMAAQDDDDGQATITAIKHNILVHWALQPPLLQMLRPIDVLVTTIHNVFPPAFGVPGHEYFTKWKAVHREALLGPGLRPDEEKMKKSVRKLRFFLHPDKLPRDLNEEQQFMCKMLWDITSDAWEEYEKHKEELDWIRG